MMPYEEFIDKNLVEKYKNKVMPLLVGVSDPFPVSFDRLCNVLDIEDKDALKRHLLDLGIEYCSVDETGDIAISLDAATYFAGQVANFEVFRALSRLQSLMYAYDFLMVQQSEQQRSVQRCDEEMRTIELEQAKVRLDRSKLDMDHEKLRFEETQLRIEESKIRIEESRIRLDRGKAQLQMSDSQYY